MEAKTISQIGEYLAAKQKQREKRGGVYHFIKYGPKQELRGWSRLTRNPDYRGYPDADKPDADTICGLRNYYVADYGESWWSLYEIQTDGDKQYCAKCAMTVTLSGYDDIGFDSNGYTTTGEK